MIIPLISGKVRVLRYPSLRAPLDILFLVCCIALTADVLVPEIWGSGKTKDYPLWFWAGQQVLQGKNLYPSDPDAYFEFIYPPLSAVLLAIPSFFGKIPLYLVPVVAQHRGVVDDGAILARDDGIGTQARARGWKRCRASSPLPSCSTCSTSASRTSCCWR